MTTRRRLILGAASLGLLTTSLLLVAQPALVYEARAARHPIWFRWLELA